MEYQGIRGTQYQLDTKSIGGGGEGDIFAIIGDSSRVVKIYKNLKESRDLEEKLKLMVQNPPASIVLDQVAWPLDSFHE